ncbi:alpha/beta hydrolase [Lacibacterium aquatile]|uniref:Palmitoyl-protein thioesterase ABHD10, mitochondrial n=1 Tax=Lacibacterium aquatile TaxID=1168082 RepID=A0ABW5DPV1_9PROT
MEVNGGTLTAQSISENATAKVLKSDDGASIAYQAIPGRSPCILFIGGYNSSMAGEKASFLARYAADRGQAFVRFDPFGHGASEGRFEDGTIGRWLADTLRVIDKVVQGPLILVGSSMGGWLMTLAALTRPERVSALVGIASAPDFTEDLMRPSLTGEDRVILRRDGVLRRPSAYGGDFIIAQQLLDEGREHLVLRRGLPIEVPVRLLHGQADPDVPPERSLRLAEAIEGSDVRVTLIKDGDHRLSRPQDLALLANTLDELIKNI